MVLVAAVVCILLAVGFVMGVLIVVRAIGRWKSGGPGRDADPE